MPWFVYERVPSGWTCAVIWHVDQVNNISGKRKPFVQMVPITRNEAKLTIDELKAKYPLAKPA